MTYVTNNIDQEIINNMPHSPNPMNINKELSLK